MGVSGDAHNLKYPGGVTGPGKLASRRLPVRRITRPAVRVFGPRKEATGDSPLFFNFTAVRKCRHLRGIRRRGVANVQKRDLWGIEYSCKEYRRDAESSAGSTGRGVE